jgi:hypothetical protein
MALAIGLEQVLTSILKSIERNISTIADQIAQRASFYGSDTETGKEFDALMRRTANDYRRDLEGRPTWSSLKDMKENGFPTPNDFAMIGYGRRI